MPSTDYFTLPNARLRNDAASGFGDQVALVKASTLPTPWHNLLSTRTT
jgi:hypothetical protein